MRRIRVRNAAQVEAEISAKAYKKISAKLKGYNRKKLFAVLDNFLFHVIEDHHVEELLKILDHFERTNSFDEPFEQTQQQEPPKEAVAAEAADTAKPVTTSTPAETPVEEVDAPLLATGTLLDDHITVEDMERSAKQMDLLYDVNYFTYFTPLTAQANAQKLIEFASEHEIPIPAHWRLIAASTDFLAPEV